MSKAGQPEERKLLVAEPSPHDAAGADELFAFPLSPIQNRIWEACRENPESTSYNTSFRWRMEGPLQPSIVEKAFHQIIDRHEILRTTFTASKGFPEQVVAPHCLLYPSLTDLRELPPERRTAEMERLCTLEAHTPFDLKKGPLLRLGLLRLEDEHTVLMLTLHHIISDGWSIGIIMEELQKIYSDMASGSASSLPALPIQFGDYVEWQKNFITTPEVAPQYDYWKRKLTGYQPLALPTDRERARQETTDSEIVSEMLPREFTDRLKAIGSDAGATMFSTTLAACTLLMRQFTNKDDIAIGSQLAGRNRPELESLIGVFINSVIFRNQVKGNPTFLQLAAQVRTAVWEVFANQDVPFEAILAAIRPEQKFAELYPRVNFICQREYARASTFVFDFAGIQMSTMPSKSQGALYDLSFFMVEREAGWRLSLEYRSDLYSEQTAHALLSHFTAILHAVVDNPERRISDFPALVIGLHPHTEDGKKSFDVAQLDCAATPHSTEDAYVSPASHAQERFWMLWQLVPESTAFNMAACVRLSGLLSTSSLEASLQTLVTRHEALRTVFRSEDGELLQVILPSLSLALPVVSAEDVAPDKRAVRIQELIRQEAELTFDLVQGPLVRARLLRLSPEEHILILTIHHILADGWSIHILERELWEIYEARRTGSTPDLPTLSIQYSDYAAWQREWLKSDEAREHLDFWTSKLSGELPVLDFPTDRKPVNRSASHGALETLLLPADLAVAIKAFGRSHNVTTFALTIACFAALLARYAGQFDVLIGSPVANRKPETEPLIGPFAGPFALRIDLSGDPTLDELLRRVQDTSMDALSHTELPFEVVHQKLNVRSVGGRNPLFQFYFFYQLAFLQPQQLEGLTVTPLPSFSVGTPFEMQMAIIDRAEGLRAQVEYNPDLFDGDTIREVLSYYVKILQCLIANPHQTLSQLPGPPRHAMVPVSASPTSVVERVEPRTETEKKLAAIWQQVLGVQIQQGIYDDFFALGGNSLLAAKMVVKMEQVFAVRVTLNSLLRYPTIEKLATLIEQPAEDHSPHHLVMIKSSGSRPPLYWIPGGRAVSVLGLREVSLSLETDQPIYGLESRLPAKGEEFPTVMERGAAYLSLIKKVQPTGPYFLAGFCTGGMVAYEMAQQLKAQGEEVAFLALVQAGVPGFYSSRSVHLRANLAKKKYFASLFGKFFLQRIAPGFLGISHASKQETRTRVATLLQGWIGSSSQLPEDTQSANEVRMKRYRPTTYAGSASVFIAEDCFESSGIPEKLDSRLAWHKLVAGQCDVSRVPGDHYSILTGENAQALAAALKASLERHHE